MSHKVITVWFLWIFLAVILTAASLSAAGTEDLGDLAQFASYWLSTNCATNNFCGEWDMDHLGSVNAGDLAQFADGWLTKVPVTFTYCFNTGYLNSMPVGTDKVRVTISGSAVATQDILRSNVTDPSANGFTTFLLLPGSYSYTATAYQNATNLMSIGPINITVVAKYRLSIPLWPALNTFDNYQTITNNDPADGTPGRDRIIQYGTDGDISLYANGNVNNDWIEQYGGTGTNALAAQADTGTNYIYQQGGNGHNDIYANAALAGDGTTWFVQKGGTGTNSIMIDGGTGQNTCFMQGGEVNDTLEFNGGFENSSYTFSNDTVWMYGIGGDDTMIYDITPGNDIAFIDGGTGNDTLTINTQSPDPVDFRVLSDLGQVIYQSGSGGTMITVKNIEHITIMDANGHIFWQWDAP